MSNIETMESRLKNIHELQYKVYEINILLEKREESPQKRGFLKAEILRLQEKINSLLNKKPKAGWSHDVTYKKSE